MLEMSIKKVRSVADRFWAIDPDSSKFEVTNCMSVSPFS